MAKSVSTIEQDINTRIANNNAGDISAEDVRLPMLDIVGNITYIVSTELTASEYFQNNIQVGDVSQGSSCALLHLASGVTFEGHSTPQTQPFLGVSNIQHNDLGGRGLDNCHSQYFLLTGANNVVTQSFRNDGWISSSGVNSRGIQFTHDSDGDEFLNVASNTTVKFASDNSTLDSSKGVARAWINFAASGVSEPVQVKAAYNVNSIERLSSSEGKFKIKFKPGTLNDTNFVAIGSSNSSSDDGNPEDFNQNTVAIVDRGGLGTNASNHFVSFVVQNTSDNYVDAKVNDLVIYGAASGVTVGTDVTGVQGHNTVLS